VYTIKHAAEVTGLPPATLRAWERRYAVVSPHRTDAGYRLYDERAMGALTLMAALVADGWSPRQAADETRRRMDPGARPEEQGSTSRPDGSGADSRTSRPGAGTPAESALRPAGPAAPGDGRPATRPVPGSPAATADGEDLLAAAGRMDLEGLTAILDDRFSRASFESVVDGWLMPCLVRLGEAWEQGSLSVAGEHLAAYAVMRRLAAAYDAAAAGARGTPVLVGLPPGSRHELGILAFAVAARRAGLGAVYLGADLPARDWVVAVTTYRARAVVLSVRAVADLFALETVVASLRATDPQVLVAVGGALQADAPAGCVGLGHRIGPAAARLADALARDSA
jgi:MerR family transcriptional regulator, light-induced transcriptional regulator